MSTIENFRALASNEPTDAPATKILAQIIALHKEITEAARATLDKAITLGELLRQEKERLGHGNWLTWLKGNVPFTERTARNYIRLYEHRDRLKSETVSDLTAAYQMLADRDRPSDLIENLPDPETLAGDVTEEGRKRLERCHTETMFQLHRMGERLQTTPNFGECLQIKRNCERLARFWAEVTLHTERFLGLCLIEIEARKKELA